MRTSTRYSAGILALGAAVGALAFPATAAAAPTNDAVTVSNAGAVPGETFLFPQGSALVGPVVVNIDTVIVDAGAVQVILDTVALLSQVTAPFGNRG